MCENTALTNVKWPPVKAICSRLLAAWVGNWMPRQKAQAGTDTGGAEGTENVEMWVSGRAWSSTLTDAPAVWAVVGPAVPGGKFLPLGQAASGFSWGWKTPFSWRKYLASLAGSDWRVAVTRLNAELSGGWGASTLTEKMIFPVTPELSRRLDLRLPVCHNSRMLQTHGETLSCRCETQVELLGVDLLFGGACKAITAIFNGANAPLVSAPQWCPCFQNKKKKESKMASLSTEGRKTVFVPLPASSNCQLRSRLCVR